MPFIDSKVTVKVSDEKKEEIKTELGKLITTLNKSEKTVVPGQLTWLDMMPKGVNKASGLSHILDYLHITPEECMAIGDNDNDREMLELVGFPAAVHSAKPSIRALAQLETDTVEHLFERILNDDESEGEAPDESEGSDSVNSKWSWRDPTP